MPFTKGHPFYKGGEKGWFVKGYIPWHKGEELSEEHKEKLKEAKLNNPVRYWLGKERSEETKEKISRANKGRRLKPEVLKVEKTCLFCKKKMLLLPCLAREYNYCSHKCAFSGEKNPNWKGGITPLVMQIRNSKEMQEWRKAVYERDNYTCQICNMRGGDLNVDHIKPFALYPDLRFDIDNGRTLCIECHRGTETFGGRVQNLVKASER